MLQSSVQTVLLLGQFRAAGDNTDHHDTVILRAPKACTIYGDLGGIINSLRISEGP